MSVFDDSRLDDPAALAGGGPPAPPPGDGRCPGPGRAGRGRGGAGQARAPTASGRAPCVAAGRDARLVRAVLEPVCPVPFVAWPGPGLPGWAGPLDLVIVLGGSTEDSDAVSAAVARQYAAAAA